MRAKGTDRFPWFFPKGWEGASHFDLRRGARCARRLINLASLAALVSCSGKGADEGLFDRDHPSARDGAASLYADGGLIAPSNVNGGDPSPPSGLSGSGGSSGWGASAGGIGKTSGSGGARVSDDLGAGGAAGDDGDPGAFADASGGGGPASDASAGRGGIENDEVDHGHEGSGGSDMDGGPSDAGESCAPGVTAQDPLPSEQGTVVAYANSSTGCIKYGGIGWLYGLSEKLTVPDEMISGLVHPQYTGQMAPGGTQHPNGDALKVADQFLRAGGRGISLYVQDYYASFPYPTTDIVSYLGVIDRVVGAVSADPHGDAVQYLPFNEPDWIWYGTSGAKLTQFEADWKKVYDRLRATAPRAAIVGPGFSSYKASAYDAFVAYCKQNDCLPDVASWDELDGPTNYYANFESYRSIEAKYGIAPREVLVKAYGRSVGDMGRPGRLVQYLARLERTKAYGSLAAWNIVGHLCDLLDPSGRPTGAWYLYQWYGQLTGNTLALALPDKNGALQAIAAKTSAGDVQVIFGGAAYDSSTSTRTVIVDGLVGSTASYEVLETNWAGVEKIPTYQPPPAVKVAGSVPIVLGRATITVPSCAALSAYLVTVKPAP